MIRWRWLACAVVVGGCAAHEGHHADPPRQATSAAETVPFAPKITTIEVGDTLPLKWTTVKMDDLKPLANIEEGGATQFSYKHHPRAAEHTLYFGEIQNDDDMLIPVIAERIGGVYRAKRVEPDWTYDQWVSVVSGPKPNEIWGILDQVNDPQAEDDDRQSNDVTVFHSTDAGKTFEKTVLRKPCRKASFADVVISPPGVGRLTLMLEEKCGNHKAGLYHYRTLDGGKTFSPPQFEEDATKPAKDVPDEEQPNEANQSASIWESDGATERRSDEASIYDLPSPSSLRRSVAPSLIHEASR